MTRKRYLQGGRKRPSTRSKNDNAFVELVKIGRKLVQANLNKSNNNENINNNSNTSEHSQEREQRTSTPIDTTFHSVFNDQGTTIDNTANHSTESQPDHTVIFPETPSTLLASTIIQKT